MEINGFKVKSYGWTELAQCYNPDVMPKTAAKRLTGWVEKNGELNASLQRAGWKKGTKLLTPLQVETIVKYIGEP